MNQILFLIFIILAVSYIVVEPFRNRRRRRKHIRNSNYVRGGWRGGYSYRPRFRRRHFYNIYNYNPYWYNPFSYFKAPCRDGCVSIGNGGWGCLFPGNGHNDCLFASDCYGCD